MRVVHTFHSPENASYSFTSNSIHSIIVTPCVSAPSNQPTSFFEWLKVAPFVLQRGYNPRHLSSIYWGIKSTKYYRNGQHYALEQHKRLRAVYNFALKNIKNMETSVAETWNHKVKYVKFHEGQEVYYFHKVDNIGHKKIKSPYHLAEIVKVYLADVS